MKYVILQQLHVRVRKLLKRIVWECLGHFRYLCVVHVCAFIRQWVNDFVYKPLKYARPNPVDSLITITYRCSNVAHTSFRKKTFVEECLQRNLTNIWLFSWGVVPKISANSTAIPGNKSRVM